MLAMRKLCAAYRRAPAAKQITTRSRGGLIEHVDSASAAMAKLAGGALRQHDYDM